MKKRCYAAKRSVDDPLYNSKTHDRCARDAADGSTRCFQHKNRRKYLPHSSASGESPMKAQCHAANGATDDKKYAQKPHPRCKRSATDGDTRCFQHGDRARYLRHPSAPTEGDNGTGGEDDGDGGEGGDSGGGGESEDGAGFEDGGEVGNGGKVDDGGNVGGGGHVDDARESVHVDRADNGKKGHLRRRFPSLMPSESRSTRSQESCFHIPLQAQHLEQDSTPTNSSLARSDSRREQHKAGSTVENFEAKLLRKDAVRRGLTLLPSDTQSDRREGSPFSIDSQILPASKHAVRKPL